MTTRPMLIFPGQCAAPVPLYDVLVEAHEAFRATIAKEVEARRKAGAPLDDTTRWTHVDDLVTALSAARKTHDSGGVAEIAKAIARTTDGNALADPGPFDGVVERNGWDVEVLRALVVTMQIVPDATRLDWAARRVAAAVELRDANARGDVLAARAANARIESVYEDVVVGVVVSLDGIDGIPRKDDGRADVKACLPGLRVHGLLGPIYSAAQHFLDLPPGKALRCGQPAPST